MFGSCCAGRGLTTSENYRQAARSRRCRWTCSTTSCNREQPGYPPCSWRSRARHTSRQEGASRADRKVRLPLRTGSGIGVQLERRAKGHTAVGGADVIDVARVGASAVLGIDQVNEIVEGGRLTPALVPPVATVIGKHAGEVGVDATSSDARAGEGGPGVGVGPSGAAVGGLEDEVGVVVRKATAAFVHAGDVQVPVARHVTRDLHVANEGTGVGHRYRAAPCGAVVSGAS